MDQETLLQICQGIFSTPANSTEIKTSKMFQSQSNESSIVKEKFRDASIRQDFQSYRIYAQRRVSSIHLGRYTLSRKDFAVAQVVLFVQFLPSSRRSYLSSARPHYNGMRVVHPLVHQKILQSISRAKIPSNDIKKVYNCGKKLS